MAGAKKLTAQQQRDRRAKIMLAVLGGVLLLVVGLQAPKLMHSGGGASAAPPAAGTTSAAAVPVAAVGIPASASQLTHFSRFKAKDPFKARVSTARPSAATGSTPASTDASSPASPPAPKTGSTPTKPPLTLTVSQTQTTPAIPAGPRVPAAILMINGKRQVIALDMPYPAKNPVFTLVAVGDKTVWLHLVGGSLSNGSQSLKLVRGSKITLVNATVNLHLVLALVKATTAPKPVITAPETMTTAPSTTTPAPPATTTTTG